MTNFIRFDDSGCLLARNPGEEFNPNTIAALGAFRSVGESTKKFVELKFCFLFTSGGAVRSTSHNQSQPVWGYGARVNGREEL